ncbi:MAG: hypothetical protein JHC80_07220 [Polynucleobacter sp.]|jgi:hypothetical protein|nr:hypothetical protein [Polynucleobacter sp.]
MQYAFHFIEIALVFWLLFNAYQSILAFQIWRKKANIESPFLSFLVDRLGVLVSTFVRTMVYAIFAIGIAYLLYEIGAMFFT